jgi:hypothetical protein
MTSRSGAIDHHSNADAQNQIQRVLHSIDRIAAHALNAVLRSGRMWGYRLHQRRGFASIGWTGWTRRISTQNSTEMVLCTRALFAWLCSPSHSLMLLPKLM